MVQRSAFAKVNLALDILGLRPDGYHEMRMVMQTISLCDTVTVETMESGFELLTDGSFTPEGKTLEQRASEAFFFRIGQPVPGLRITLDKRTPAYAGLGGGSADVAALLRILREQYQPDLSEAVLEEIGAQIGSDMPFCLRGGTALAEGRGEILTDLPPLPACWFVLCKPAFGIPTASLFAQVDGKALKCRPDTDGMILALREGNLDGIAARLRNVFEEILPAEYREVTVIRNALLEQGALNAVMSGSGPTVFGIFREEFQAKQAAFVLSGRGWETFIAEPVGRLSDNPMMKTV